MPTARLVQLNAWSYSRYTGYTQCPYKCKLQNIDKMKEPPNQAMTEGSRVHAIADVIVSGRLPEINKENREFEADMKAALKGRKLPKELETFAEEFKALKKAKGIETEAQWTFDKAWNPLGPSGWFSSAAWLRIKVDAFYFTTSKTKGKTYTEVHIIDFKTGRPNPDHEQQRSLYALGAFLMFPDIVKVRAEHWYLGPGLVEPNPRKDYRIEQLPALKKEWTARTEAMLNDTTFAPRPGNYCQWCFASAAKGGPCKF